MEISEGKHDTGWQEVRWSPGRVSCESYMYLIFANFVPIIFLSIVTTMCRVEPVYYIQNMPV